MSNHDNILNIKTDGQIAYENMKKYFEEIIDKKKKISDIINNEESLLHAINHGGILQLLIKKGHPEMVYETILPKISLDNIDDEILSSIFSKKQMGNNKKNISKYLKSINEFTLLNLIDNTTLFKGKITKSDIEIITDKVNDPFFLPENFLLKLLSSNKARHIKILEEWIGKYSKKDIIFGIHETNIILNLFQKKYYTSAIMLLSQVNSIKYLDDNIFKHINENINNDIIQKGIAKWFNQLCDYNAAILLEKIGCIKYNGFSKQKNYSPEIRFDYIKEFNIHKINKVCALITNPKITIFIPSEYPSHNDRKDDNNETNIIFLNEILNKDSNNTKGK